MTVVLWRDVNKGSRVKAQAAKPWTRPTSYVYTVKAMSSRPRAKSDSATEGLNKSKTNNVLYFSVICSFFNVVILKITVSIGPCIA